jgi:hypothetical protein
MTPAWEVRTLRDWGVLRWWEEDNSPEQNLWIAGAYWYNPLQVGTCLSELSAFSMAYEGFKFKRV